jgi:Tol biopolymer transport system component
LNEDWNEIDPNWSPDGNSIVFSYFPLFDRADRQGLGVYSIDLKTGALKKLPGSEGLWAPRWSADGSHIVARSTDSLALLLFDFKEPKWTTLARGESIGSANWSSDGRYVYYVRRGNEPAIMRVGISNGNVEQVADLKAVRQTGFRNAIWTGLTPDDSPLVLRDVGLQEIYSLDLSSH